MAIIVRNAMVLMASARASFFLPSKYHIAGRAKIRRPITAAEMTKVRRKAMAGSGGFTLSTVLGT